MAYLPFETSMGGGSSGGGLRVYLEEVQLGSPFPAGTGTINTPFSAVHAAFITQKDATAVADGVSWTATGGTITVDSSNGSSAEIYSVLAVGI
tara:strand:+ start:373 stop:651 length:279 start_codon:yes stop_codon:yes gene_type:complete